MWLQNSAKDGDARFEECGLGVVGEYEMELLTTSGGDSDNRDTREAYRDAISGDC